MEKGSIVTLVGLRIDKTQLKRVESVKVEKFCSCTGNDVSKPFCAWCGNNNTPKYINKEICLLSEVDGNSECDGVVNVSGRKWNVLFHPDNHFYREYAYILCCDYSSFSNKDDDSSFLDIGNMDDLNKIVENFRDDMKEMDFWEDEEFGVHTVYRETFDW